MSAWRKLKYLLPSYRHAEERDMQEELESLAAIAGPRELGNLTLAAENARGVWGWAWLEGILFDMPISNRMAATKAAPIRATPPQITYVVLLRRRGGPATNTGSGGATSVPAYRSEYRPSKTCAGAAGGLYGVPHLTQGPSSASKTS